VNCSVLVQEFPPLTLSSGMQHNVKLPPLMFGLCMQMRHQLQREYDELRTQEAIFTLNKMAHLTGISSDIFDVSQSGDESATTSDQEGDSNCSEGTK